MPRRTRAPPRLRTPWLLALAAAVLALQLHCVDAKYVYGRGYFGTQRINEVTKFSFRPGKGRVLGNITFQGEPRGSLYLFMDTNWAEKFHNEADCEKVKHAHTRIPIGRSGFIGAGVGEALGWEPVRDENSAKTSWGFEWTINHAVRTYGWYFVIADCRGFKNGDALPEGEEPPDTDLTAKGKSRKNRRTRRNMFEFEISLFNPDDDHLPADEGGLPTLYFITTAGMAAFFWHSARTYRRKTGNGLFIGSHAVIKAFAGAYVLQISSMALELLHLWRYSSNGRGFFLCDFLSESFEGLAQLIMSFALLCLANGWTLIDLRRGSGQRKPSVIRDMLNRPQLDDEAPTLFVLVLIVFVSTVLQVINKIQDDSFSKFHDYDGLAGKFLLVQRTVLGIAFVTSIRSTMASDEAQGQMQLQGFLSRLALLGAVYLFAFPVLVLLASLFAHYLRHRVVTGGVLVIQAACLTLMTQQFLSNSSWYAKVSEVATAGMLPGAFFGAGPAKAGKLY